MANGKQTKEETFEKLVEEFQTFINDYPKGYSFRATILLFENQRYEVLPSYLFTNQDLDAVKKLKEHFKNICNFNVNWLGYLHMEIF